MNLAQTLEKEIRSMYNELYGYFLHESDIRWVHNRYPPGLGKSKNTIDLIAQSPEDFDLVFPNHKMIYGNHSMVHNAWNNGLRYQARIGKTRRVIECTDYKFKIADDINLRLVNEDEGPIGDRLCLRDPGMEYVPGCKDCPFAELCLYTKLNEQLETRQLIFTPIHVLSQFPHRNIIFDESIEQEKLRMKSYTKQELKSLGVILEDHETIKIHGKVVHYYNNISVRKSHIVNEPQTEHQYFFNLFIQSTYKESVSITDSDGSNKRILYTGIHARKNRNNRFLLFGEFIRYLPYKFKKIIYNCATIPEQLLKQTINTEDPITLPLTFGFRNEIPFRWETVNSKTFKVDELSNDIFQFKFNWTKKSSEAFLPLLQEFLVNFYERKKVLIVTKMKFEEEMSEFSEFFTSLDVSCVHYNAGRGFNSMEMPDTDQYDLVIVYGRFGFDQYVRDLWKRIGYTDKLLDQMEMNEILQALHRCRPLKHPQIPIMIMSDRKLLSKMKLKKHPINAFKMVLEENDLGNNATQKELSDRIGKIVNNADYNSYIAFKKFLSKF